MARCLAVAISQAPGLRGTPGARPLLERGDERVLRQLLGEADVAARRGRGPAINRADSIRQTASTTRSRRRAVDAVIGRRGLVCAALLPTQLLLPLLQLRE